MNPDITSLPAPLTPPDCDLQGLEYLPLYGAKLFGASLYLQGSAEEFRAGVRLLWAAWEQRPAGSIPACDVAQAVLADMGRDVQGWRELKDRVLAGWVMCSDGRLYNPFLCEQALKALAARKAFRERQKKCRAKKKPQSEDVTRDIPVTSRGHHGSVTDLGEGRERSSYGTTVPSLTVKELPAKGTPGLGVPAPRLPATANSRTANSQQPPTGGRGSSASALDGNWRRSKEGIQAKAAEMGIAAYDAGEAQRRKAPSWSRYRLAVLQAHAELTRLRIVGGRQ